jgi:antirestriction protein ArdC
VRHADYLKHWLDLIREDNRAIIRAASAASKAADYLLAFRDRAIDGDRGEVPNLPSPEPSPPPTD